MVIIMRGVSGSGKSTVANSIANGVDVKGIKLSSNRVSIVSADDYFIDQNGSYNFDKNRLSEAHAYCMRTFVNRVSRLSADEVTIVDNTNTTVADVSAYARVASAFGHHVVIACVFAPINECAKRNRHNVPLKTIQRQHDNLIKSDNMMGMFGEIIFVE